MKAIRYNSLRAEWNLCDALIPEPGINEELIQVIHAGLCGSDMHRIESPIKQYEDISLGHEITGRIIQGNRDSSDNLVIVNPIISCSVCPACISSFPQLCTNTRAIGKNINGGFSEYITAPRTHIYSVPVGFTPQLGVLVDGVAVIINALSKAKDITSIKNALIIGDGTVGALALATMRTLHPRSRLTILGKNPENARMLGNWFNATTEITQDNFDIVFETVGRQQGATINFAIDNIRPGGKILVLGVYSSGYSLGLNARSAFYKEASIIGVNSFVSNTKRDDFLDALNLINANQGLYEHIITHQLPLEQFATGIDLMRNKKSSHAIKVIFNP